MAVLYEDLPYVMDDAKFKSCQVLCVPRAKALNAYKNSQLFFKDAVYEVVSEIKNGLHFSDCITRVTNTKTTHLKNSENIRNDGELPYPGITAQTCKLNVSDIQYNNVILVDDIYTPTVNVDEDCIQYLLDNKVKSIVFYAIAYTNRNASNLA